MYYIDGTLLLHSRSSYKTEYKKREREREESKVLTDCKQPYILLFPRRNFNPANRLALDSTYALYRLLLLLVLLYRFHIYVQLRQLSIYPAELFSPLFFPSCAAVVLCRLSPVLPPPASCASFYINSIIKSHSLSSHSRQVTSSVNWRLRSATRTAHTA